MIRADVALAVRVTVRAMMAFARVVLGIALLLVGGCDGDACGGLACESTVKIELSLPATVDMSNGTTLLCHNAGCTEVRLDANLMPAEYLRNDSAGTVTVTQGSTVSVSARSLGPPQGADEAGTHHYRLELRDAAGTVVVSREWKGAFEGTYNEAAGCTTCWTSTAPLTEANAL